MKKNVTKLDSFSQKKKLFLEIFPETYGNITKTAEEAKIDRRTYYYWTRTDEAFKQAIEDTQPKRMLIDLAKSQLIRAVENGDITAIIFTLKTLGKNEGFSEKQIIETVKDKSDPLENMTDEELDAEIERIKKGII